MQANGVSESAPPPGVVELREDVPLKVGSSFGYEGSSRCCGGGPRFILACFAALSAGITLALLTQIYYGDYEVVPHGSVSSSAAACSRAGTDALKAGGRAMDAAATAALCLAVLAPHRTSLDASGSLIYWEYRSDHSQPPVLTEWGELDIMPWANDTNRPPKMLAAFASLHASLGVLPWSKIVQPAITIARSDNHSDNFNKPSMTASMTTSKANSSSSDPKRSSLQSKSISVMAIEPLDSGSSTVPPDGSSPDIADIADYLQKYQYNTSAELSAFWNGDKVIRKSTPQEIGAGKWKVYAGGAGAVVAATSIAATLLPPEPDPDTAFQRVVSALQQASLHGEWPPSGVASGLAVVDRLDTYIALVTGLSQPYGSVPRSPDGWSYDEPKSPLDLAPAIIVAQHVCESRYIIGAESSAALAQGATALLTNDIGAGAVEKPRVSVYASGILGIESSRPPPNALPVSLPTTHIVNATLPYPAVNVVMQNGDSLTSHADSRGGGLASRF